MAARLRDGRWRILDPLAIAEEGTRPDGESWRLSGKWRIAELLRKSFFFCLVSQRR